MLKDSVHYGHVIVSIKFNLTFGLLSNAYQVRTIPLCRRSHSPLVFHTLEFESPKTIEGSPFRILAIGISN